MKKINKKPITGAVYDWEVPEIDLQLKHYIGNSTDVIKKIKLDIENYLKNNNIPQQTREIYSAVYCALDYYKASSHLPSAEFYRTSALSNFLKTLNTDYTNLSNRFKSDNPNDLPVIDVNARIKSPASFIKKVREKINEYIEEGRDLSYFNESLRDLMGARIIITPPSSVQNQGPQAESDYLYQVVYSFMEDRGINRKTVTRPGDFKFLPVNTRYDSHKLEYIKSRPEKEGFDESIKSGKVSLFIPERRIPEFEEPNIDSVVKDYNMWPRFRGYQSIHICVIPDYSNSMVQAKLPPFILPQKTNNFYIEYQFRTSKQHDFAEHGFASHKEYKPLEDDDRYHRLRIPIYISHDSTNQNFRLLNFAESYELTTGHTFKDRFGIDFDTFIDRFTSQERNEVLAGIKRVEYDSENIPYLVKAKKEICDSQEELSKIVEIKPDKKSEIAKFFETHGARDNTISVASDPKTLELQVSTTQQSFELYTVQASSERKKELSKDPNSQLDNDDKQIPDDKAVTNPHSDDSDGPEI